MSTSSLRQFSGLMLYKFNYFYVFTLKKSYKIIKKHYKECCRCNFKLIFVHERGFLYKLIQLWNSNFGIVLDGSNYIAYFHFRRNVCFSAGPKKYKNSTQKFIFVRRDAADAIVIERKRISRTLIWILSGYSHLIPKIGKCEMNLLNSH